MESAIKIVEINTLDEMMSNYHLVVQLTPSLNRDLYYQYLQNMVPHNYFQIVASIQEEIVGISGFWIATKLYCGKYLEIDNFIVDEQHRSKGIGHLLIKKLEEIAQQNQCDVLMLDAYLHNTQAHKFYEQHQFSAKGYHFIKKVASISNSHECLT